MHSLLKRSAYLLVAKSTGLTRGQLSHYWGEKVARKAFNARGIVHSHNFDLIYWRGMDRVMQSFPEMFHVFITKQVSHFCVTNIMLSIIDGTTKNQCPSCGCPNETTTHITRCLDPGRSTAFLKSVKSSKDWLITQKNWRPNYQLHHSISPCPWPHFNDSYHPQHASISITRNSSRPPGLGLFLGRENMLQMG